MSAEREIISILRSLLSDLHYASEEQAEYVARHGYCLHCYSYLDGCSCREENSSEESDTNSVVILEDDE